MLVAPWRVLAVVSVLGGMVVAPFAELAAAAGTVSHGAPVTLAPAYHLDARPENLMALAAWALGGLLLVARRPVGMGVAGPGRGGRTGRATADLRGRAARRWRASRLRCTTGRCATCAPASRPCSYRPAC